MITIPDVPSPGWITFIQDCWKRAKSKVRANVEFLCPQQSVSFKKSADPSLSVWNVAVCVKPVPWQSEIPDASIEVRLADFYEETWSPKYHLRWFSKDHEKGRASLTLRAGRTYRIPLVRRSDGDNQAELLNETIYNNGPSIPLKSSRYMVKVAIHSGARTWISGLYFLSVPKSGGSNGLFYLQRQYDDQRPKGEWVES